MTARLELIALPGIPMLEPGADLAAIILAAVADAGTELHDGDVLVVAQKIVSKTEGRYVALATVTPSARALELAAATGKDARIVELVLRESSAVLRFRTNVLVVRHRLGFVVANAGIDQSNIRHDTAGGRVLLLPADPDESAERLRDGLARASGRRIGVVVSDSHGRPFRLGTLGTAIGAAGINSLWDQRGLPDLFGRRLEVSEEALANELAAAAALLQGQAAEGRPVVLVRGYRDPGPPRPARSLVRASEEDLFRQPEP